MGLSILENGLRKAFGKNSDGSRWVPLRDVKLGDYVRLVEGGPVWVRSEYDRKDKRFYLDAWADINRMTKRKGDTLVLVDFTF